MSRQSAADVEVQQADDVVADTQPTVDAAATSAEPIVVSAADVQVQQSHDVVAHTQPTFDVAATSVEPILVSAADVQVQQSRDVVTHFQPTVDVTATSVDLILVSAADVQVQQSHDVVAHTRPTFDVAATSVEPILVSAADVQVQQSRDVVADTVVNTQPTVNAAAISGEQVNTEILSEPDSDSDASTILLESHVGREKVHMYKRKKATHGRLHGSEYVGYKRSKCGKITQESSRTKKTLQCRCGHGSGKSVSSLKCGLISDAARQVQFSDFWALESWEEKQVYVSALVDTRQVKRRRVGKTKESSKKQVCHDCYLKTDGGIKVLVCRKMFLNTLALGEDQFRRWTKSKDEGLLSESGNDDRHDDGMNNERGHASQSTAKVGIQNSRKKVRRSRKDIRRADVKEWLDLLPKVPSHYCRASSSKVYVECTFRSLLHMYDVYSDFIKSKGKVPVSRMIFTDVLKKENIAIHSPRKDQCDTCFTYKSGNLPQFKYDNHIIKKDEARNAKIAAKEKCCESVAVITMDLQSVLRCPRLQASAVYYHMKLQLHNFSFYKLNDGSVTLYVWNESSGGVTANEFTSCVTDYIRNMPDVVEHVILISDGCSYQNRNRVLSSALADISKMKNITVEQLILEKGHTMMEVDSVHATLENIWSKQDIYSPTDYLCYMRQARPKQPYEVKSVDYTFFRDYEHLTSNFASIRPGKCAGAPVVTDIRGLQYKPNGDVNYRLRHSDEWKALPCRRPAAKLPAKAKMLYSQPLKLSARKFQHLQELKELMPADYHAFYDSLAHD